MGIDYTKVPFQQELKKEMQIKGQLRIFKQYKVKRAVKRNVIVYLTKLHSVLADLFSPNPLHKSWAKSSVTHMTMNFMPASGSLASVSFTLCYKSLSFPLLMKFSTRAHSPHTYISIPKRVYT